MQTIAFPAHSVRRLDRQRIHDAPPGAIAWLIDSLGFTAAEIKKMKSLNSKVRAGTLTESEQSEADQLIKMGHELDRLRAEALLATAKDKKKPRAQ